MSHNVKGVVKNLREYINIKVFYVFDEQKQTVVTCFEIFKSEFPGGWWNNYQDFKCYYAYNENVIGKG